MLQNFSSHGILCLVILPPVKDMYDYQGRSYLHVPQDVGINLRSSDAPDKCYLPKKQIHVWSGHTKVSGMGHGCVSLNCAWMLFLRINLEFRMLSASLI